MAKYKTERKLFSEKEPNCLGITPKKLTTNSIIITLTFQTFRNYLL